MRGGDSERRRGNGGGGGRYSGRSYGVAAIGKGISCQEQSTSRVCGRIGGVVKVEVKGGGGVQNL